MPRQENPDDTRPSEINWLYKIFGWKIQNLKPEHANEQIRLHGSDSDPGQWNTQVHEINPRIIPRDTRDLTPEEKSLLSITRRSPLRAKLTKIKPPDNSIDYQTRDRQEMNNRLRVLQNQLDNTRGLETQRKLLRQINKLERQINSRR